MIVEREKLISNMENWVASLVIRENIGIMNESTIRAYYRLKPIRLRGVYNDDDRYFLNSVRQEYIKNSK